MGHHRQRLHTISVKYIGIQISAPAGSFEAGDLLTGRRRQSSAAPGLKRTRPIPPGGRGGHGVAPRCLKGSPGYYAASNNPIGVPGRVSAAPNIGISIVDGAQQCADPSKGNAMSRRHVSNNQVTSWYTHFAALRWDMLRYTLEASIHVVVEVPVAV